MEHDEVEWIEIETIRRITPPKPKKHRARNAPKQTSSIQNYPQPQDDYYTITVNAVDEATA